MSIAREVAGLERGYAVEARRVGGKTLVNLNGTFEAGVPNGQADAITEEPTFRFRRACPQTSKASVHPGSRKLTGHPSPASASASGSQ